MDEKVKTTITKVLKRKKQNETQTVDKRKEKETVYSIIAKSFMD